MSVEQTTQLIQLILNSVLMGVACALVLGGLTARHGAIRQQLQSMSRPDYSQELDNWIVKPLTELPRSHIHQIRHQIKRLRYRYQISRYSVLSAYYALLFSALSCFALVLRGLIQWNGLIPFALGLFVLSVATLLVAIGLTLVDWHLSDRALLEEVHKLLSGGSADYGILTQLSRHSSTRSRATTLRNHQKMRVG